MRLTYDRDADALYIRWIDGDFQCRVVRLNEEVALDFAEGERLVGIEVLRASSMFDTPDQPTVVLEDLIARVS